MIKQERQTLFVPGNRFAISHCQMLPRDQREQQPTASDSLPCFHLKQTFKGGGETPPPNTDVDSVA